MTLTPFEYHEGKCPVLLELPHGGHLTPDEVKSYLHPKFTPGDRREDSDEFSDALYLDLPIEPHVLRFSIWRAHADPNRKLDDFHSDGVVKTHTSQGVKIYQSERGLPEQVRMQIVENHIRPYHEKMIELLGNGEIKNVIFCHTMPGIGTRVSGDKGNLRPLFMFGNGGDTRGNNIRKAFAPKALLLALADVIESAVHKLDVDFNFCDVVRFNDPYTGANSLNRFDPALLKGKNAFTLEINRDLILHNPENTDPVREIIREIVETDVNWSQDYQDKR